MAGRISRICIFGDFGSGNLGNEGSLEAMVAFLKQVQPGAELVCLCRRPESVMSQHGIAALPYAAPRSGRRSIPAKLKALIHDFRLVFQGTRGIDLLIVPGTGLLDDFGDRPYGMPLTAFWVCLFARLRGANICFVSIGAGPIENRLSRRLMKSAAAMAHYRSYRDLQSKEFIKGLGIDVNDDEVYPDIAFKLKVPQEKESHGAGLRPLTVGVGMMTYRGWRMDPVRGQDIYAAYLQKMTVFVLWLLDSGYRVRVLMGENSDERAISDLSRGVRLARPNLAGDAIAAEPASSLTELMAQIIQTDIVVATRFHNVVSALKAGRPAASLGYAAKNAALLSEMGLSEFCQHVETFDVEVLKAQVTKLIQNREFYEKGVRHANAIFEQRLRQQDCVLASTFLGAEIPVAS
jgi:polysaccharide pyruvyl transferase WcaK-like protein